ncbi:PhzF family phenazine biosynthesis protein [Sporobolomyces salmoneus]|uniref:PhzF family phenazine biosynthesis protein n=1 Tax=Sporobolomyces salmoneus TaxID=183962 RepID=UPI00316DAB6E
MTYSKVALLDAFGEAYGGNPAAVVLSTEPIGEEERRNLAKEFNQPAIAFVSHPSIDSPESFAASSLSPRPLIRYHISSGESIPLCGHATMAASAYLLDHFAKALDEIRYEFRLTAVDKNGSESETSHELVATRCVDGRIEIALPASPKGRPLPDEARESVLRALKAATGLDADQVEGFDLSAANAPGWDNLIIQLSQDVDLEALQIDPLAFLTIPYRGIYLTNLAPAGSEIQYFCRVFFPSQGLLEDHVCGYANTRLGPFWIAQQAKTDSPFPVVVEVHQVSPRGGRFALRWNGKSGEEGGLVALRGKAKLIMEGQLRV